VKDCLKSQIPITVIAPPYTAARAGISDHAYVTRVLGKGTHSDVGPNFPWAFFAERITYWRSVLDPSKPPPKPGPVGPADDQLTMRWNMLGGQTLVEALAEVRDKLLGTADRTKPGIKS
jgi:hypothetical protein